MSRKTERAVYQLTVDPNYGFFDDPEWGVDLRREDCLFVLTVENETGFHACNRSAVWDDMTGYVDTVQHEDKLPEGNYIVTYFEHHDGDLWQMAEIGVSKSQIIQNVLAQKYVEGADYFLMEAE